MWARYSHTLATLTKITSTKVNFRLTEIKQDAFNEIKRITACNNLLTYPDFNEEFNFHTDTIKFKLGVMIIQKGETIAFYSRKLTGSKNRYIVT